MERGKVDAKTMASTLNSIVPTLEYSAIKDVDLDDRKAVVENPQS